MQLCHYSLDIFELKLDEEREVSQQECRVEEI